MSQQPAPAPAPGEPGGDARPVIRDRRKVDPATGQVRHEPGAASPSGAANPSDGAGSVGDVDAGPAGAGLGGAGLGGAGLAGTGLAGDEQAVAAAAELIAAQAELAERTEDLQRLQAEYVNYRKRVDRDRDLAGERGRAEVLSALIPVLDDIDAARQAGDLDGPFAAVSEKLEAAVASRFGLERYGAEGEPFDPTVHEAIMHQAAPEATGPTVGLVVQPGYRMGERILRPARVGVIDTE